MKQPIRIKNLTKNFQFWAIEKENKFLLVNNSLYIWQNELPIISFIGHVYVRKFKFLDVNMTEKMKLSVVHFVRCTGYKFFFPVLRK